MRRWQRLTTRVLGCVARASRPWRIRRRWWRRALTVAATTEPPRPRVPPWPPPRRARPPCRIALKSVRWPHGGVGRLRDPHVRPRRRLCPRLSRRRGSRRDRLCWPHCRREGRQKCPGSPYLQLQRQHRCRRHHRQQLAAEATVSVRGLASFAPPRLPGLSPPPSPRRGQRRRRRWNQRQGSARTASAARASVVPDADAAAAAGAMGVGQHATVGRQPHPLRGHALPATETS